MTSTSSPPAPPERAARAPIIRAPILRLLTATVALLAVAQLWLAWDEIRTGGMDFQQDYIAAQRLVAGDSLFTPFSREEVAALGGREELGFGMRQNAHPPFAVLLVVPLTLLPFWAAALLWTLGSAALLALIIWRVAGELGLPLRGMWRLLLPLLMLNWYPVWLHLHLGQWTILLTALVVEAWAALRRGRDGWAGALLGLAALIKLYPLLLFGYALWRGRWRALAAGAAAVLALVLAQTAIDPRHYAEYIGQVAGSTDATWRVSPRNASLSTVSARLFAGSDEVRPLIDLPAAELPARAALYALALAAFAAALWRRRRSPDLTGELAALVCAMLLLSPLTWEHTIIMLLLPFGYVLARARAEGLARMGLPAVLAGLALLLSFYPAEPVLLSAIARYHPEPAPAWLGLHAPGLLVLLSASAATLIALRRPPHPGPA